MAKRGHRAKRQGESYKRTPAKKLTANQLAYNKELRRIDAFIKRAAKRGFVLDGQIAPPRPERISKKSIAQLKALTPAEIYKQMKFVNPETGEITSGAEEMRRRRSAAAKKAAQSRKQKKSGGADNGPSVYDAIDILTFRLQQTKRNFSFTRDHKNRNNYIELNDVTNRIISAMQHHENKAQINANIKKNIREINETINEMEYLYYVESAVEYAFTQIWAAIFDSMIDLEQSEEWTSQEYGEPTSGEEFAPANVEEVPF